MKPYEYSIISGGIQRANFLPALFAIGSSIVSGAASLAGGAASLAGGAVSALGSAGGFLGSTAIGAGGTVLGGIGSLGTGIIDTSAGLVKGAGTALFGGQTITEMPAGLAGTGYGGGLDIVSGTAGGLFSNLSWDTLSNVASVGYSLYSSEEQRKLAEKAIEAQRGAGYVVGAPGAPVSSLAPTTSIAIPAAAAAAKELDTKVMIKYAIIALIAFFLFKGVK